MLLNAHGSDHTLIDVIRAIIVVYGVVTTGWIAGRLFGRDDPNEVCLEGRALHAALLILWLPIWLTEAQQIGKPWLFFRLPLAVAAIPATWWAMRAHRQRHHVPPRRVDPWWWPVSALGSRDGRAGQPRDASRNDAADRS